MTLGPAAAILLPATPRLPCAACWARRSALMSSRKSRYRRQRRNTGERDRCRRRSELDIRGRAYADQRHHHRQVRVVDLAGNVGATGSQSAQIDTVNPAQVLTIASISTGYGEFGHRLYHQRYHAHADQFAGAGFSSGEVAQISLDGGATRTTPHHQRYAVDLPRQPHADRRQLRLSRCGCWIWREIQAPVVSKTVVVDTINPPPRRPLCRIPMMSGSGRGRLAIRRPPATPRRCSTACSLRRLPAVKSFTSTITVCC